MMDERNLRPIDPRELGETSPILSTFHPREEFVPDVLKPHLNHTLDELEGKAKKSTIRTLSEYARIRNLDESILIGGFIERYLVGGESMVQIHRDSGIELDLATFYHIMRYFGVRAFNRSEAAKRQGGAFAQRDSGIINISDQASPPHTRIPSQKVQIDAENQNGAQRSNFGEEKRQIPENLRPHIGHGIEELEAGDFAKKIIRRLRVYEARLDLQGMSAIDYLTLEHHYDKGLRKLADSIGISPQALKRIFTFLGIPCIDGDEGYSRAYRFAHEDEDEITRDKRGRIRWKIQGNSEEENIKLGIKNVQSIFFKHFPEFNKLFPRPNGVVDPVSAETARVFILERIGTQKKFSSMIGAAPCSKKLVPYFGSHLIAIAKSFGTLGIKFIDNLVAQEQTSPEDDWTPILEEYEQKLLNGEIMSYEEFTRRRQA